MLPNKIEKLVKKMRYKATNEAYDKALDSFLTAVDEHEEKQSASNKPKIWRVIMKSPITKLAAVAVIIIACVIGLSLWRSTGSGIALADVLARVEQVKSFRCKMSFVENGQIAQDKRYKFEVRSTFLLSREYGCKINAETPDPNGGWMPYADTYISDKKKLCVVIAHTERKYVREELDDYAETQGNQEEDWSDPSTILKAIMDCKYENLGRSTIDGVEVVGFRTTDPNCRTPWIRYSNPQVDVKLWVDVKTRLPVRGEEFSSSVDESGNTQSKHQVAHDFEWNVPVTAAEFDPPPVLNSYAVLNVPRLNSDTSRISAMTRGQQGEYSLRLKRVKLPQPCD